MPETTKPKKLTAAGLVAKLRARGFDKSYVYLDEDGDKSVRVKCGQCEAMVIQGMACHERGCPNSR
jgi:hypothetical protein